MWPIQLFFILQKKIKKNCVIRQLHKDWQQARWIKQAVSAVQVFLNNTPSWNLMVLNVLLFLIGYTVHYNFYTCPWALYCWSICLKPIHFKRNWLYNHIYSEYIKVAKKAALGLFHTRWPESGKNRQLSLHPFSWMHNNHHLFCITITTNSFEQFNNLDKSRRKKGWYLNT